MAMATSNCVIFVAVVADGKLLANFVPIVDVDLAGCVAALVAQMKARMPRLGHVNDYELLLFGPQPAKPNAAAFKKWIEDDFEALDPSETVGNLVGSMTRAYFVLKTIASSWSPSQASVAGASRCSVECGCIASMCRGRCAISVPLVWFMPISS